MSKGMARWSYAGDENTRAISAAHWIPGLVVPPLVVWRIVSGGARNRIHEAPPEPLRNHA
jgi:hypothetical protein